MIRIPAGWFWMGSDTHYDWERPRHRVFVDEFFIAPTSVTREEYARFLAETHHEEPRGWRDPLFENPALPVVGVSWFDAVAYCDWLSCRLPTEAEWEKACRGGLEDRDYAWGNEAPESLECLAGEWRAPRLVAQWAPNRYGLFNIGDNVHEWCSDWYSSDYYGVSPSHNPLGPESGTRRVSRGGSWRHQIKASRAAHRSSLPPEFRYTDYGFRVVRGLRGDLPRRADG